MRIAIVGPGYLRTSPQIMEYQRFSRLHPDTTEFYAFGDTLPGFKLDLVVVLGDPAALPHQYDFARNWLRDAVLPRLAPGGMFTGFTYGLDQFAH